MTRTIWMVGLVGLLQGSAGVAAMDSGAVQLASYHDARSAGVAVAEAESGEKREISIRGKGIGVNPEFHDRIFVIPQWLHGREEYEGTGIGPAFLQANR